MTDTRQYDLLNRLTVISSLPAGAEQLPVGFVYQYNDANQRTRATLQDGSYWVYEYDTLGQVISAKRYWMDGSPVPGQQFDYGFDDIGNRSSTKAGGNAAGAGLRSATYSANNLNQYTSRTVPGAFDVSGVANANETVTVNGSAADYRRGEYFQELVNVDNSSGLVWSTVSVTTSGGGSTSGKVFVPRTPENYVYDFDGNLTSDGRWTYVWDAENRLIQMTPMAGIPDADARRLNFGYDHQGRRIWKRVDYKVGGNWTTYYERKFLYDGWNLIAELFTNDGVVKKFLWGLDLSGTEQGAGGVGGLLKEWDFYTWKDYFAGYDGNGNVALLTAGTDGTVAARYEYGPFGEPIRSSGSSTIAASTGAGNPFRFSTKYTDAESDLLNYGHRYYNPSIGRWLSRDPIGERGGANLAGFVRNCPVSTIDSLGLRVANYDYAVAHEAPLGTFRLLSEQIKWGVQDDIQDGFHLWYRRSGDRAHPCPCGSTSMKGGSVILIQAISGPHSSGDLFLPSKPPHIDASANAQFRHWNTKGGIVPPAMNSPSGTGPLEIRDAPHVGTAPDHKGTWELEVCAICRWKDGETIHDRNLGCVRFQFIRDGKGSEDLSVMGGILGREVPAALPGSHWQQALERWQDEAGKDL